MYLFIYDLLLYSFIYFVDHFEIPLKVCVVWYCLRRNWGRPNVAIEFKASSIFSQIWWFSSTTSARSSIDCYNFTCWYVSDLFSPLLSSSLGTLVRGLALAPPLVCVQSELCCIYHNLAHRCCACEVVPHSLAVSILAKDTIVSMVFNKV